MESEKIKAREILVKVKKRVWLINSLIDSITEEYNKEEPKYQVIAELKRLLKKASLIKIYKLEEEI